MSGPPRQITGHIATTLWLGFGLITACEALLFIDVSERSGVVLPSPMSLAKPIGLWAEVARWVAVNMTLLCWIGYLLLFEGLLATAAKRRHDPTCASLRARPNRFVVAWLTSIPVWCFFDWINFSYLGAWQYHGLPPHFYQRLIGYFIAFAAISPGMFLTAQWFQVQGLNCLKTSNNSPNELLAWCLVLAVNVALATVVLVLHVRSETGVESHIPKWTSAALLILPAVVAIVLTRSMMATSLAFGAGFITWAILVHDPVGNLTVWVALIFLLDPINHWLGGPSILQDWRQGRWGRWIALMLGGATCGLCWEFWNYWAVAKWTYQLPFLGDLERHKIFEMPWLGFLGFLPFAVECWVVLNTIILCLERLGPRGMVEPLPNLDTII